MEVLITISLVLVIILAIMFIAAMALLFKFVLDLRDLLRTIHDEADRVKADIAGLRSRATSKTGKSLLTLGLGLIARRQMLKKFAAAYFGDTDTDDKKTKSKKSKKAKKSKSDE